MITPISLFGRMRFSVEFSRTAVMAAAYYTILECFTM